MREISDLPQMISDLLKSQTRGLVREERQECRCGDFGKIENIPTEEHLIGFRTGGAVWWRFPGLAAALAPSGGVRARQQSPPPSDGWGKTKQSGRY